MQTLPGADRIAHEVTGTSHGSLHSTRSCFMENTLSSTLHDRRISGGLSAASGLASALFAAAGADHGSMEIPFEATIDSDTMTASHDARQGYVPCPSTRMTDAAQPMETNA